MTQSATHKPWLIAAWPGMGDVAVIAASYLIQQLDLKDCVELVPGGHLDVLEISVKGGLVEKTRLPRGAFFRNTGPPKPFDPTMFISEAQPSAGNFGYPLKCLMLPGVMGRRPAVRPSLYCISNSR